ncbi:hypothetical protein [Sporomusa aerivorans]|uniref:hypothetical protein n=1 Tax=Sporomusa aerivorans TaxID=204936 RepID=UPI00352A3E51
MNTPFTLRRLIVNHKEKELFNVDFTKNKYSVRDTILSTVIIGANGAGKSYLLTVISELFRVINNKQFSKEINMRYEENYLEYSIGADYYEIEVRGKVFNFTRNKLPVQVHEIELPRKILAVSYMVNDKFVFKTPDIDSEERYEYLGIRQTSNAAWTNSLSRRICDAFIEHSANILVNI